jgi:hypothetical protein
MSPATFSEEISVAWGHYSKIWRTRSLVGQQHALTARVHRFRFTPINRPKFKMIVSSEKCHKRL